MNKKLNDAAVNAVTAEGFETQPHYCQRWVRQVVQSVYGKRFNQYFKKNARKTAEAFRNSPYYVPLNHGSVPGDLLYKTTGSGGDGHVGIRVLGNKVAENSSVHWDGKDARGFRPLTQFGNFDVIVRLPDTEEE